MPHLRTPGHDRDDITLLHRVAAGDRQAFEMLYQRYVPRLKSYVQTLLKSQEQIEDVIQDVLLVVWQQSARYRGTAKVSTWLFGIARNTALRAHGRETRRACAPMPMPEPTTVVDPEHQAMRHEDDQLIRQALASLSSTQRELLRLTYEHGYSVQAIAALQDCSTSTVHYRKQQAYRRLATQLKQPA